MYTHLYRCIYIHMHANTCCGICIFSCNAPARLWQKRDALRVLTDLQKDIDLTQHTEEKSSACKGPA